ncbi:C-type lectin domain family 2 member L-like isoform X1 [Notechis scutatus]|uniref:C-type lectin domain family 2 member L-like isoform X1 n=2 Tax=Notechis scutatus TaxID=8663 RepID=A0A6J1UPC4_9SAUR|nr:C-type lectin domain family 2 member L-like isoform X1 [Notechis scutatus]
MKGLSEQLKVSVWKYLCLFVWYLNYRKNFLEFCNTEALSSSQNKTLIVLGEVAGSHFKRNFWSYHTRGVEHMEDQRKVFGSNLDDPERNYQNVLRPNRKKAMKAKSGVPSFGITSHTGCISSRASKIILYILVCVSLLMATAAFLLACLKFIPQCPKGWLKFQTNCYYFSADQQPWEMAMSSCQSLKAHLVVIDGKNDTDKQEFLDRLKNSSYWIGLRRYPKDKWMWINGRPFPELTQSVENNEKENCMYNLWKDSKSRKKKIACTEYLPYICEKEQT